MNTVDFFREMTLNMVTQYQPICTELNGVRDLAMGTSLLGYSCIWRLRDANDLGTGTPIATQSIWLSGMLIAQGLMRLAFPIIFSVGYLVSRYS